MKSIFKEDEQIFEIKRVGSWGGKEIVRCIQLDSLPYSTRGARDE